MLENTYETAAKRATDYNHKLIEIVRTNTCAAFDNLHELLGAKSPSEFFELSTAQMRKQFEIVSGQNKLRKLPGPGKIGGEFIVWSVGCNISPRHQRV